MTPAAPDEGDVSLDLEWAGTYLINLADRLDRGEGMLSTGQLRQIGAMLEWLTARDARVAAEVRAAAWDEGYAVGRDDEFDRRLDRPNPYRTDDEARGAK